MYTSVDNTPVPSIICASDLPLDIYTYCGGYLSNIQMKLFTISDNIAFVRLCQYYMESVCSDKRKRRNKKIIRNKIKKVILDNCISRVKARMLIWIMNDIEFISYLSCIIYVNCTVPTHLPNKEDNSFKSPNDPYSSLLYPTSFDCDHSNVKWLSVLYFYYNKANESYYVEKGNKK